MIVSLARQLCSGIHKVQEEGECQEVHGDETDAGSAAGAILGLLPRIEKDGEYL
jgi:hypothetical protein